MEAALGVLRGCPSAISAKDCKDVGTVAAPDMWSLHHPCKEGMTHRGPLTGFSPSPHTAQSKGGWVCLPWFVQQDLITPRAYSLLRFHGRVRSHAVFTQPSSYAGNPDDLLCALHGGSQMSKPLSGEGKGFA